MQELAANIFIENNSLGLYAGVIRSESGSILIDSPVRLDEERSWRGSTARLVMGEPRFLISLDTNYDRLLSSKGSDCVLIAHQCDPEGTRGHGGGQKSQVDQSLHPDGYELMSSGMRSQLPEISFSGEMSVNLDDVSIRLEHHPGCNNTAIWAILPQKKVVFVGDTVLVDQPPFLAFSNLDVWLEDLKYLASPAFKGYKIVSARDGIVEKAQVRSMETQINAIKRLLDPLMESGASMDKILDVIPKLMKRYNVAPITAEVYYNRLVWGLSKYHEIRAREGG